MDFKGRIVLVANVKQVPDDGYAKHMSNWDITKRVTNYLLARAIRKNGYELIEYSDLNAFIRNLDNHLYDLVFPFHFGVGSKIRQSYVQTFCESKKIKFIGADAYAQTIGNDKALSKEVCRYANIKAPAFKIFFDKKFPPDISVLRFPIIVKPQFEGDSIGISEKNIFQSPDKVLFFACKLMNDLRQPVLIEEFIQGREISICVVGHGRNIRFLGCMENTKRSIVSSYFDKKFRLGLNKYRRADEYLTSKFKESITSLFHSLDKLEFARFDFIYDGHFFYNIEITADPDLSQFSCLYQSVKDEFDYAGFINMLIVNCIDRYSVTNKAQ